MDEAIAEPDECAAWVPNVSGHLSFSTIGKELVGSAAIFNSMGQGAVGAPAAVVAAQRRVNPDSWIVLRWMGYLFGNLVRRMVRSTYFPWLKPSVVEWFPQGHVQHFILIGRPGVAWTPYFPDGNDLDHRRDDRGALRGVVFIVGEEARWRDRRAQATHLRLLFSGIENLHVASDPAEAGSRIEILEEEFRELADAVVDFSLFRTGELRLSVRSASPGADDNESLRKIRRHAYYFVRDSAHRHYHHSRADDRLLPAVELSGDDSDISWRREVLWALSRTVGEYRRSRGMAQRRQALGVIAYADAFQATLARIKRRSPTDGRFERTNEIDEFDFKHIKASIQVSNEVAAWHRQGFFAVCALAIASTISLSAFWVAAERVAEQQHWLDGDGFGPLVKWVYSHQGQVIVILGTLLYLLWDRVYAETSRAELLVKTFWAFTWPSRRRRSQPGKSLYLTALIGAALIITIVHIQLGLPTYW